MGLFGKRTQPERVDRDQVMRLIKTGMDLNDARDRDIDGDDPRVGRAQRAWYGEVDRSTRAEQDRAHEALTRHGYVPA
jgi:hypothetical protein